MIVIIIGLTAVFCVFTSSLIISSHQAAQADRKDVERAIKKIREKVNDRNDDRREELREQLREDNREDEKEDEKEVDEPNYNYNFADEGDNKLKNFNFVAAGDYGCSKNAKNTINSMLDRKPELVLPLGDLSVDNTATCWLDLVSPFDDKLEITFG